jgi:hypothetical protein
VRVLLLACLLLLGSAPALAETAAQRAQKVAAEKQLQQTRARI